jgi:hypothetical protein
MATRAISMLGANTMPDTSGNCWMEPYSNVATNDVWPFLIFRFGTAAEPTTRIGLHGRFTVPQDYVGSALFIPVWTAIVTAGNCVWDIDYRTVGGDDTTSMDQAGSEQSVTVTDAAPSAVNFRLTPSLSPTAANFAVGEDVEFTLFRDGTDANDTMAGTAILFDLIFQYSDV